MTRDEIIAMARGSEWLSKYESATGFSAECAIKFANLLAQRKWVGLDEIQKPDIRYQTETFFAGAEWAERMLKEKNT